MLRPRQASRASSEPATGDGNRRTCRTRTTRLCTSLRWFNSPQPCTAERAWQFFSHPSRSRLTHWCIQLTSTERHRTVTATSQYQNSRKHRQTMTDTRVTRTLTNTVYNDRELHLSAPSLTQTAAATTVVSPNIDTIGGIWVRMITSNSRQRNYTRFS